MAFLPIGYKQYVAITVPLVAIILKTWNQLTEHHLKRTYQSCLYACLRLILRCGVELNLKLIWVPGDGET